MAGSVRNALLVHYLLEHERFANGREDCWTDWRTKADRIRAGEPVNFHGDELPEDLRRTRRLDAAGYYGVDATDRVRPQPDYP